MAFGDLLGTLAGNGASIGANNNLTGSVVVAIGDLVFAVLGQQTNLTASGATDNLGNSYTAQNAGTDAGTSTGRAFWARVTVAGTLTTVTIAASSSTNDWAGLAAVIAGPFVTSPLDTNPANGTDITSPFNCPATGTLAQASEVIMCWGTAPQSTVWAATSPNLLAGNANNSTNIKVAIGYQAVAATTTVTPVFTAAANPADDTLGTASFKKDPNTPLSISVPLKLAKTLAKQDNWIRSASLKLAPAISKLTAKNIRVSQRFARVFSAIKAGGSRTVGLLTRLALDAYGAKRAGNFSRSAGSNTPKTVSASLRLGRSLSRQTGWRRNSYLKSAPRLQKQTGRTLVVWIHLNAVLTRIKAVAKNLTAYLHFAERLSKQAAARRSAYLRFAVIESKQTGWRRAAAQRFSARLTKQTARALQAWIRFRAAITTLKAVSKILTIYIRFAIVEMKRTNLIRNIGLKFTARLTKQTLRILRASLRFRIVLTALKAVSKTLTAHLNFAAVKTKQTARTLSARIRFARSFIAAYIPGGPITLFNISRWLGFDMARVRYSGRDALLTTWTAGYSLPITWAITIRSTKGN